jgi:DNA-binding transcriptional LysR family regulator
MAAKFTLKQLAYFVTAAEVRSTTAAAAEHFMSQSSMSAALTDLEVALGVQLFSRRRGKGMQLTGSGRALLPEARRLVEAAEVFGCEAGRLQQSLNGRLTIGCYTTIAPGILPPLLQQFAEVHPDVEVEFSEAGQAELYEELLDGRTELAIVYDHEVPPGLEGTVMFRPVPHLLVLADHPLAGKASAPLDAVAAAPFIMCDLQPSRSLTHEVFAAAGVTPQIRFHSANPDHVRALVQRGAGYSMVSLPIGASPGHWHPDLRAIPVEGPVPRHPVIVATLRRAGLTGRAKAFRDLCLRYGAGLDATGLTP